MGKFVKLSKSAPLSLGLYRIKSLLTCWHWDVLGRTLYRTDGFIIGRCYSIPSKVFDEALLLSMGIILFDEGGYLLSVIWNCC